MLTVGQALADAYGRLLPVSDSPRLEARLLLSRIVGESTAWLYAHREFRLDTTQTERYGQAIEQRASGFPMAYILGSQGFFHWDFNVSPDVLIPRPETELVVETAVEWLHTRPAAQIVDVGTGSGCIAIALALLLPDARISATDISPAALAVARCNAQALGASHIQFFQGHLLDALPDGRRVDLITANLPYIPNDQLLALDVARWEPKVALDGGIDGLALIRQLLQQAPQYLQPGGVIMLEMGADQMPAIRALGAKYLSGATISIRHDLAGLDRLVIMQVLEPLA